MTEPDLTSPVPADSGHDGSDAPAESLPATAPASRMERAPRALLSLERFADWVRWGLVAAGCLAAIRDAAALTSGDGATSHLWLRVLAHVTLVVLCYTLLGWGIAACTRFTGVVVSDYLARVDQVAHTLRGDWQKGIEILERIARSLDERTAPGQHAAPFDLARERAVVEIQRATQTARWSEAERLLAAFEADYPGANALVVLKDDLGQARDRLRGEQLAELEAARQVNDPDGVLEIFQKVGPLLDAEPRGVLERDLGKWFLAVIHRRLRTGTIQVDVVQLAGRFAEAFATTPEGASVRASLPTLRRSVGLCPRCAQAYTGVAAACPKCLAGPAGAGPNPAANGEARTSE
jgi:hypothetical protein